MTPFHLNNKTIFITGASSGIGRQIAISISEMGGNVVITGRNEDRLKQTISSLKKGSHSYFVADLANENERENLISNLPQLDGLVQSAGVVKPFPIKYISQEKIDETLNINFEVPLLLMAGITRHEKLNNNSSVVFISSISGQHPYMGASLYAGSKAALENLSKVYALENYHLGIRSNCISPAMVKTEMYDETEQIMSKEIMDEHVAKYPLGVGQPEDVANTAVFLLSEASKWITGINIVIDGGFLLK
jgi:NAD(P)-dependent dehydrogenase (short-subunit alcohol dehydrogenase family)